MKASPLLTQAMQHIVNHPDEHDQATWFCGTKACLAGRIVAIAGGTMAWDDFGPDGEPVAEYAGQVYSLPALAERLAHLYLWEASWLWDPERTMPELYREVNLLERGLAPTFWVPHHKRGDGGTWWDQDGRLRVAVHRGTVYNACYEPAHYTNTYGQDGSLELATRLADRYGPLKFHPSLEKGHERWLPEPKTAKSTTPRPAN